MKKSLIMLLVSFLVASAFGQNGNFLLNADFSRLNKEQLPAMWNISIAAKRELLTERPGWLTLKLGAESRDGRYKVSFSQALKDIPGGELQAAGHIKGDFNSLCIVAVFPQQTAQGSILLQIPRSEMRSLEDGWLAFTATLKLPQGKQDFHIVYEPFCDNAGDMVCFAGLSLKANMEKEENMPSAPEKNEPAGKKALHWCENMIARPAAASQVSWQRHQFCGSGFWQVLKPDWLSMMGIDQEEFVQNSAHNISLKYSNQEEMRGDLRKTKIMELELIRQDKNTAPEAKLQFTSPEEGVIFYAMHNLQDGDLKSCAFIIGPTADFRNRHAGVPFEITISQKNDNPLQKIRFLTERKGSAPIAWLEVHSMEGEVLPATYRRSKDDTLWELILNPPVIDEQLIVKGVSRPSFYQLMDIPDRHKERLRQVPFMSLSFYFRSDMASIKKENIDRHSIRKFQREFAGTFVGQFVGEVGSNYFQKRANPMRFREQLAEQAFYVPVYDRDRQEAEAGLKLHWKRHMDFFGELCAMSGGLPEAPYFYEWGSPMVLAGSINEAPYSNNRSVFSVTRSAARQYGKPWAAYLTSYAGGTSASSRLSEEDALKLVTPEKPWHDGLDFGLAPSVFKRCQYIAYYSGVNFQLFETDPLGMAVKDKNSGQWSLTQNGVATKDLYDWTRKEEGQRGDLYAPMLLLADYYNGNWEWKMGEKWKVWYLQDYQDGDYMFQHALRAFDPFPGHNYGKDYELQVEKGWSLVNSKLGDIYDLYFANPPSGDISVEELGKYPLAMLLGDVRFSNTLLENLKTYVQQGGTLVINAAQDRKFFADSEFSGVQAGDAWLDIDQMRVRRLDKIHGEIVTGTADGTPLVVKNRYGQGNVIFMTPYFLLDMNNKKLPLPLLQDFLEKLQDEVCPVQVQGNVHFLFNRMPDHSWKLVLFNHRGVYKNPMRSKEGFHPEYAAKVHILAPAGTQAREVRLNQPMSKNGNAFELTVPSGEICVVDLKNVEFDDRPINAGTFARKGGFEETSNPNHGLLLQSDFTEQRGATAVDTSGRENHGKLIDGPVYVGDSLKFDSDKAYVYYNLKVPKTPLYEGTIECWARPEADKGEDCQMVMTNEWVKVGIDKGRWFAQFYDFVKTDFIQGEKVAYAQWTHLLFTWDRNMAYFYVNGKEVIRQSGPLLHVKPLDGYDDIVRLFLGTHHFQRSALFKGQIAAVRYYGHTLSGNQILENFQQKQGKGVKQ